MNNKITLTTYKTDNITISTQNPNPTTVLSSNAIFHRFIEAVGEMPILTDSKALLALNSTYRSFKSEVDKHFESWVACAFKEDKPMFKSPSEDATPYLILFFLSLQYADTEKLKSFQTSFLHFLSRHQKLFQKITEQAIKNLKNFCESPTRVVDVADLNDSGYNLALIKSIAVPSRLYLEYGSTRFTIMNRTEENHPPFILVKRLMMSSGKSSVKNAEISIMSSNNVSSLIELPRKYTLQYLSIPTHKKELESSSSRSLANNRLSCSLEQWLPLVEQLIDNKKLSYVYHPTLGKSLCEIAIALKRESITDRVKKVLETINPELIPSLPANNQAQVLEVPKTLSLNRPLAIMLCILMLIIAFKLAAS